MSYSKHPGQLFEDIVNVASVQRDHAGQMAVLAVAAKIMQAAALQRLADVLERLTTLAESESQKS